MAQIAFAGIRKLKVVRRWRGGLTLDGHAPPVKVEVVKEID
jgi:hypothetical protein